MKCFKFLLETASKTHVSVTSVPVLYNSRVSSCFLRQSGQLKIVYTNIINVFPVFVPSDSKPIAVVERLRNQRLWPDAMLLRTSVSGPTNFIVTFFFF